MFIIIIHLLRGIVCCQQRATYNSKVRDDGRKILWKNGMKVFWKYIFKPTIPKTRSCSQNKPMLCFKQNSIQYQKQDYVAKISQCLTNVFFNDWCGYWEQGLLHNDRKYTEVLKRNKHLLILLNISLKFSKKKIICIERAVGRFVALKKGEVHFNFC